MPHDLVSPSLPPPYSPSSTHSQEAAYDYMEKEGERMFLECLDQLEVARAKLEDVSA